MPIFVPRVEAIMVALETLLASTSPPSPFDVMGTVTRVWQPWDELASISQPAIVITEPSEEETSRRGQQPAIKLDVKLICYIQVDPKDVIYPPNTRVNGLIEAIRTRLLPTGGFDLASINAQTLGGLVSNVYIDGRVIKDSGIIDNQGSALIPVTVLIT